MILSTAAKGEAMTVMSRGCDAQAASEDGFALNFVTLLR
jgi:hypothetical protein